MGEANAALLGRDGEFVYAAIDEGFAIANVEREIVAVKKIPPIGWGMIHEVNAVGAADAADCDDKAVIGE